jgi:competence protein ComEA
VFTRDERRALLFLLAVAGLGGAVRAVLAARSLGAREAAEPFRPPPSLSAGDVQRQAALARRAEVLARPLVPGEKVDVDRAEAAELERLPRVGPGLARRIVEDRQAHGPFGSWDALGEVSGIGPGMRRELERWVTFSAVPRPPAVQAAAPSAPGLPSRAGPRADVCGSATIPVNRADASQLACLPGVGPGLAARIVAERAAHGPFREVQDLERVPGLGPGRLARLRGRVVLP